MNQTPTSLIVALLGFTCNQMAYSEVIHFYATGTAITVDSGAPVDLGDRIALVGSYDDTTPFSSGTSVLKSFNGAVLSFSVLFESNEPSGQMSFIQTDSNSSGISLRNDLGGFDRLNIGHGSGITDSFGFDGVGAGLVLRAPTTAVSSPDFLSNATPGVLSGQFGSISGSYISAGFVDAFGGLGATYRIDSLGFSRYHRYTINSSSYLVASTRIANPAIAIEHRDGNVVISFTGVLEESIDLVAWRLLTPQPSSPYTIAAPSGMRFWRARLD